METLIVRLRAALEPFFPDAAVVLRRLREGGLLPAGRPGRFGANSARISPEQAGLILLGCFAGSPIEAPKVARQLAEYREPDGRRLLAFLSDEIEATAADPGYRAPSLQVAPGYHVIATDPAATGLHWRSYGRPVDTELMRERVEFLPAVPAPRPQRGPVMGLLVGPEPIAAAAAAFRASSRPGSSTLLDTASQRRGAAP